MKKSFDVKINVDNEVYEYGITNKEIYEFIENLQFSDIIFDHFNTLIGLFPYFDIYNNIIINVNLV